MKPYLKIFLVVLVLGLFVTDVATAQGRGRGKRKKAAQSQETETQPVSPLPEDDAELVSALELFVYPAGGQDAAQQGADETECAGWARGEVEGLHEDQAGTQEEEAEQSRREQRQEGGRSALKGAAAGALIGEALEDDDYKSKGPPDNPGNKGKKVYDEDYKPNRDHDDDELSDAEKGAIIGAVAGGIHGRRSAAEAETEEEAAEMQAATQAERDALARAMTVCLESKDYKVE